MHTLLVAADQSGSCDNRVKMSADVRRLALSSAWLPTLCLLPVFSFGMLPQHVLTLCSYPELRVPTSFPRFSLFLARLCLLWKQWLGLFAFSVTTIWGGVTKAESCDPTTVPVPRSGAEFGRLSPFCSILIVGAGATYGVLGHVHALGNRTRRVVADGGARVAEVLTAAELEDLVAGVVIPGLREPAVSLAVGEDVEQPKKLAMDPAVMRCSSRRRRRPPTASRRPLGSGAPWHARPPRGAWRGRCCGAHHCG